MSQHRTLQLQKPPVKGLPNTSEARAGSNRLLEPGKGRKRTHAGAALALGCAWATALPLRAGDPGTLPAPFPAFLTLRTATAPFRLVFEVQHDPNRRGAGPSEKRQGAYSVEHYSDPFEAFVQEVSFVAFKTPFSYRTPEGRVFTGNKIYAFYAPSNLHGTLTPECDVRLAHGPLECEVGADCQSFLRL